MESLNLNTLAHSLPNANNLAKSEKDLLNNFKGQSHHHHSLPRGLTCLHFTSCVAAALSITTLYRSSRQTSKRAYNAGYGAACQDLLVMIQQGVSVGGVEDPLQGAGPMEEGSGNAMTIGKVMDWIEARLEAVKSREEEEDEDEEKEKERGRGASNATSAPTSKQSMIPKAGSADNVAATLRHKDTVRQTCSPHHYLLLTSSPAPTRDTTTNAPLADHGPFSFAFQLSSAFSIPTIHAPTHHTLHTQSASQ
jgi:hypothetical protein